MNGTDMLVISFSSHEPKATASG